MSLHFDITGDNSNFLRKLDEARNGIRSTSKQIEESGMSIEQMFGRMAKAAAAFGVGFSAQQFVSQVTKVRGEFQQLEVAFNTMLGSKEQADTLMSQLVRTAAITPFDLQGVANGAKQLLAYGTAADDVNGTLVRLGDIAAGLSIPLNDLVWLYGTTMTQGRLFTQDLRQFQGRGIPLADELAKQFGVTKDKVGELVTAGKVGFPEVQKAIESMTNEGGKFGGLMEAQSKTISGQISNIEDAIATAFNKIGKDNESIINSALSGTAYLVEHWDDVAIAIESAAVAYGSYKAATMTVAAVQGAEATLKIDAEIEGLQSLLVVKEKSKNADLEAAVASGTLTEAKAMQLASLREELATRLTVLKLKEEEAIAEQASALAAFNSAKQVSDTANDKLEKMNALYEAALAQGDASYEQYAMEQLQTASANANTASTTLNTAEKNLNAASSKRKAASEAVDTMATQANTVANHANTASMNIMKLAGVQLTTMLKGVWATLMANPLMLVAGAVIGLGYALYKVVTAETEAETATRMYNEALDEQKKKQDEYKEKVNTLIKTIDDNNKSEGERLQAFEALKAEYPTVLNNLLTEAEYLKEIAKYKKLIAEEDDKRSKSDDEESLRLAKLKLREYEIRKKQGITLVDMNGNGWSTDNVDDAIKAQMVVVNKAIAKVASHNVTSYLSNIKDLKNSDISSVIDGINTSLKALGKSGDDAIAIVSELGGEFSKSQLLSIKNALETEQKSRSGEKKSGVEWLADYKKAYEDAEKAYNDFLKSKEVMSDADRDKELKRLKEERDLAKTTYENKGGSTSSDTKQESAAEKLRKEQEKLNLLLNKQSLEQKRASEDLQTQVDQSRIDAMKEGSFKTLEQMKLDHSKEMQQLDRQQEDLLRKKIEDEKALFDAEEDKKAAKDPRHVRQTFDGSKTTLSQSEKDAFANQKMYLDLKQVGETQAYLDKERQAWNDYLSEYGTFQEKKEAITAEYNEKISKTSTEGEKASLKKELENKIKEVNFEEMKSSINFADIFGNLDTQSTDAITNMRDKLKEIIEKSAKDLKPTDLKALQDAFKDIDLKVSERNPFGELKQGIDDYKTSTQAVIKAQEDLNTVQKGGEVIIGTYIDSTGKICTKLLTQAQAEKNLSESQRKRLESQSKLSKSINSIGEKGQQLVTAGNDLCDTLTNLGIQVPEAVTGTLEGLGKVMSSLESIDLTKPFSIITSITGMLSGISKTIGSWFGINNKVISEETFAEYDRLVDAIDELLDKQNELIKNSDSVSAEIAANEAKVLAERKKQAAQNLNLDYLSSYDGSKHTVGYNLAKDLSGYRSAIENAGINWDDLFGTGRMEGLADLDADQIRLLQGLPEVWAKLPEKVRDFLNDVVEAAESANEVTESMKENLTGVSFDGFKNSFLDTLKDMDSSSKDFADNLEDYIKNAMLQSLLDEVYADDIKKLYEKLAAYRSKDSEGGSKITEAELADLRKDQKDLSERILADRDSLADIYGWESPTSQSSTKGGFETMSQDTGNELNGRFTALQISNEEIKNSMLSMLTGVNLISTTTANNGITLTEIRNLAISSNSYLEDIAKFTKPLLEVGGKLDRIESNTKGLTTR